MVINTLLMSVIVYNCLVEGLREHPNTLIMSRQTHFNCCIVCVLYMWLMAKKSHWSPVRITAKHSSFQDNLSIISYLSYPIYLHLNMSNW